MLVLDAVGPRSMTRREGTDPALTDGNLIWSKFYVENFDNSQILGLRIGNLRKSMLQKSKKWANFRLRR